MVKPSYQVSRLWNYGLTLWNPVHFLTVQFATVLMATIFLHFPFQHFEFLVLNVVGGAVDLFQVLIALLSFKTNKQTKKMFSLISRKFKYVWKLCLLPTYWSDFFAGFCSDHRHKLRVCGHKWSAPTKPNTPTSSKGC